MWNVLLFDIRGSWSASAQLFLVVDFSTIIIRSQGIILAQSSPICLTLSMKHLGVFIPKYSRWTMPTLLMKEFVLHHACSVFQPEFDYFTHKCKKNGMERMLPFFQSHREEIPTWGKFTSMFATQQMSLLPLKGGFLSWRRPSKTLETFLSDCVEAVVIQRYNTRDEFI